MLSVHPLRRLWLPTAALLLPVIASAETSLECQVNVNQQWKTVPAQNLDFCLAQVDAANQDYNALGFKFGKWNGAPIAADRYSFYQSDDGGRNWRTLKAKSELTRPDAPNQAPIAATAITPPPPVTQPITSPVTPPSGVSAQAAIAAPVPPAAPTAPLTPAPISPPSATAPAPGPSQAYPTGVASTAPGIPTTALPPSAVRPRPAARPAVIADSHGPYFTPTPGPATDTILADPQNVEPASQSDGVTPSMASEATPAAATSEASTATNSVVIIPGSQPCTLRDTAQRKELGLQSLAACVDALDRSADRYDGNGYKYAFWGSTSLIADRNNILSSAAGESGWTLVRSRGQR